MLNMIDLRTYDDCTYKHSLRVALISVYMGVVMELNNVDLFQLALSGVLHDIGKMSISKDILNKQGKLTDTEFEEIKKHPSEGVALAESLYHCQPQVLSGIMCHHEKYDGTGYPNGLKGCAIPLFGRIIALADVYDALTSVRPYRKPCFPNEAIEYIMGSAEQQFDLALIKEFLKVVAAYPDGTIVRLSNGEEAVVIKNHTGNMMRPTVRLLRTAKTIDLYNDTSAYNITIESMGYDENTVQSLVKR